MLSVEDELLKWMEEKESKLCPYRLDVNFAFRTEAGAVIPFERIWQEYGCIKELCTGYRNDQCIAVLN